MSGLVDSSPAPEVAGRWGRPLAAATGIVLLAAVAIGLIWLAAQGLHLLTGVSSEVLIAIVTVIGGLFSVLIARYVEASNDRQAKLREKKVPIHEAFLEAIVGRMMTIGNANEGQRERETNALVEELTKLTPSLIIWASDDVLREWSRYRRHDLQSGDPMRGIIRLESVLRAIRRDLGHRNWGLKPGDVLGTYINDVDDVLRKRPDLVK